MISFYILSLRCAAFARSFGTRSITSMTRWKREVSFNIAIGLLAVVGARPFPDLRTTDCINVIVPEALGTVDDGLIHRGKLQMLLLVGGQSPILPRRVSLSLSVQAHGSPYLPWRGKAAIDWSAGTDGYQGGAASGQRARAD